MQINFSQNIKNVNSYPKIGDKKVCSNPISFCGVDGFEKSAVKFSKEFCMDAVDKFLKVRESKTIIPYEEFLKIEDNIKDLKKQDPDLINLKKLATKYRETLSLDDKKNLLKHEENIHWQELETPERGLLRNVLLLPGKKDFIPVMNVSNINGLMRIRQAYDVLGLKIEPSEEHFNLLKKITENTSDDSSFSYTLKKNILKLTPCLTNDSESLVNLSKYVKENTKNNELKMLANTIINDNSKYNELALFNELSSGDLQEFEKISVIKTLVNNKSKKLTEKLPTMVKDANGSGETKLAAIWAMGKCKSGENFDLLCKIANSSDSKNLEAREMALHSLPFYMRTNEKQVKETLNGVIKEKSELSELATILLEKTEGRYYAKDKELAQLTKDEKSLYKKMRNKYVKTELKLNDDEKSLCKKFMYKYIKNDFKMNIPQTNILDRALAPLRKALVFLNDKESKIYIANETSTRLFQDNVGQRCFFGNPSTEGYFEDSIIGSASPEEIFVNKKDINVKSKFNVLAHEFNHQVLFNYLSDESERVLSKLYKNAVEKNSCLDFYAKTDKDEYFAQGYEAYTSVYKPHNVIIENNSFNDAACHIRSTLKRKDPDLYDFIESLVNKYNTHSD